VGVSEATVGTGIAAKVAIACTMALLGAASLIWLTRRARRTAS